MYAIVESNKIKELIRNPKSLVINDVMYPSNIFGNWSVSELEAIGIYVVNFDNTNYKDPSWYTNTDQTFTFASNKVTASYGDATAKSITDTLYTAQDETDGIGIEGQVKNEGLKTKFKRGINANAGGLLQPYDWYSLREMEGGTAMPSNIKTWRANVRAKANEMCTKIDACSDVDALATLYDYVDDGSGNYTRPLGEFPELS